MVSPVLRWHIRHRPLLLVLLLWSVLAIVSSHPLAAQAARGAWQVTESRSPMTDERTITVKLRATTAVAGSFGPVRPTLVLRCREGEFEAYVDTDMVLDSDLDDESRVRLRWDDDPPVVQWWNISTSHQGIFAPDPVPFVMRGLVPAHRLRLEFTPHGSGARVATFALRGFTALLPALTRACPNAGWPVPEAPLRETTRPGEPAPPPVTGPTADAPQTYFEFQVDRSVALDGDNPAPAYPAILRTANVEGEVIAQFVVSRDGTAEMATFKILKSSHDLFTDAVKTVLPQMRFRPAEVGGSTVRQLVQMPFVFSLNR